MSEQQIIARILYAKQLFEPKTTGFEYGTVITVIQNSHVATVDELVVHNTDATLGHFIQRNSKIRKHPQPECGEDQKGQPRRTVNSLKEGPQAVVAAGSSMYASIGRQAHTRLRSP